MAWQPCFWRPHLGHAARCCAMVPMHHAMHADCAHRWSKTSLQTLASNKRFGVHAEGLWQYGVRAVSHLAQADPDPLVQRVGVTFYEARSSSK